MSDAIEPHVHDDKIPCAICGARVHVIQDHLKNDHPEVSVREYTERWPGAPLLSPKAQAILARRKADRPATPASVAATDEVQHIDGFQVSQVPLAEAFDLPEKLCLGKSGNVIRVSRVKAPEHLQSWVPQVDPNYHFPVGTLKVMLLGMELGIPSYAWGHAGTGKSTLWEQICARLGRPVVRVQHTANTEESHVIGQYVVKDGATLFELGPLPYAMKHGLVYQADEYDFGRPSVLSLYQPVTEGKPLVIKEADPENRVIHPHPMFRFVATGNTNGTGDETGLYAGTLIQNAANYERFGIVEEVHYMEPKIEAAIVAAQGGVPLKAAEGLVAFATLCRDGFRQQKIGLPPSPRAMINAARVGLRLGDMGRGVQFAYINRLSRIDQEAVREILKRVSL